MRRGYRAAEDRCGELGKNLVGKCSRIGRALEGKSVERRGDRSCQHWGREAKLEALLRSDPLQSFGKGVPHRVASRRQLALKVGVMEAE